MCGAFRYTFTGQPLDKVIPSFNKPFFSSSSPNRSRCKSICYCLTCRKITSSAFALTLVLPASQVEGPSPSIPEYKTFTVQHESGLHLEYSFCGNCATICWKKALERPSNFIIFAGTLDDQDALEKWKPDKEIWVKYRTSWVEGIQDLKVPQFDGFPPGL